MLYKREYRPGPNPSQTERAALPETPRNARKSPEYAAITDRLPFPGGWPREEVEKLLAAHQLVNIASDLFLHPLPQKSSAWRRKGSSGTSVGATPSGATCRAKPGSYQPEDAMPQSSKHVE